MTAIPTAQAARRAGAVSHDPTDWHAIHWRRAYRIVRRLQARIVKAVQAGPWGKVRALQHLLTHSFSAKALAVRRVTENQGKRTPGVDRVTWKTPEQKATAMLDLWRRQDGRCSHCGEAMTTLTGWHSHHRVWRSHSGSDTADNQVLLHPTCHRQVHHALGSTRMPPPVTRGFGKA